jgi:iron complex outermembrane receptor protein
LRSDFNGYGSVTLGQLQPADIKAASTCRLRRQRMAGWPLCGGRPDRDGFGENLVTGAGEVSDKEVRAVRATLGAYVGTDSFDLQFTFDHVDDGSGVRGAQMLRANPYDALLTPATARSCRWTDRYDVRNGMPNVNDTTLSGASVVANFRMNDDWTFKSSLRCASRIPRPTSISTPLPDKIADVKAFYSDEQQSPRNSSSTTMPAVARAA